MSFTLNYAYYSRDDSNDCTTRAMHIEGLIAHGITDKAAYLGEVTE